MLAEFKTMMANDYGIPCNSIRSRNSQANTIVERAHQTIGNMICTLNIQQLDIDNENPWEGIHSSIMFTILTYTAVRSAKYGQLIAK